MIDPVSLTGLSGDALLLVGLSVLTAFTYRIMVNSNKTITDIAEKHYQAVSKITEACEKNFSAVTTELKSMSKGLMENTILTKQILKKVDK